MYIKTERKAEMSFWDCLSVVVLKYGFGLVATAVANETDHVEDIEDQSQRF